MPRNARPEGLLNFAAVPTPSFTPAPPPPAIVVTVPSTHQGTPGEARGVGVGGAERERVELADSVAERVRVALVDGDELPDREVDEVTDGDTGISVKLAVREEVPADETVADKVVDKVAVKDRDGDDEADDEREAEEDFDRVIDKLGE